MVILQKESKDYKCMDEKRGGEGKGNKGEGRGDIKGGRESRRGCKLITLLQEINEHYKNVKLKPEEFSSYLTSQV